jgi:hypothetical protein
MCMCACLRARLKPDKYQLCASLLFIYRAFIVVIRMLTDGDLCEQGDTRHRECFFLLSLG